MGRSRGSMLGYRSKFALLSLVVCLCVTAFSPIATAQRGGVRKSAAKKKADAQKQDPPAAPAYTPSPLQPVPLDQVPAVAPKVTFESGQLTIIAHNCTLADVLHAIKKQMGADLDVPPGATERVVADLGPGAPRDVITDLLNGTHFNYVIVGSPTDPSAVQSLALTPKSGGAETASAAPGNRPGAPPGRVFQPGMPPSVQGGATPPPEAAQSDDDNSEPPEEATDQNDGPDEQQAAQQQNDQQNPGQQAPKTPEQLLQELQRQQQQQQQQGQQRGGEAPQPQGGLFPNQPPTQAPPNKPD
jgi:hypothetical protein